MEPSISFRSRLIVLLAAAATVTLAATRLGSYSPAVRQTGPRAIAPAPYATVKAGAAGPRAREPQIPFIANEGQYEHSVQFYAPLKAGTVYVTREGEIHYALSSAITGNQRGTVAMRELFVGASVQSLSGSAKAPVRVSYHKQSDPTALLTDIAAWNSISFGELYDGIELRLQPVADSVEKRFVVQPAAQPDDIRIAVEGAAQLTTNAIGELEAQTQHGTLAFARPEAWQVVDGRRRAVNVSYEICGLQYGFACGDYDSQLPLIIQPCNWSEHLHSPEAESWSRRDAQGAALEDAPALASATNAEPHGIGGVAELANRGFSSEDR